MKTMTITYHHTTNYGASLQTYALHRKIKDLGHENVLFEYPEKRRYYNKIIFSNPKSFIRSLYFNFTKLIRKKKHFRLIDSFDKFRSQNIEFTRVYESMDDLRNNYPDVEALITGSDQVWNMKTNPQFIPARFLNFGKPNLLRFSYAASIESLNYTDEEKKYVKDSLSNFKGISLREESAKNYIKDITGLNAIRVMDPVFLLSKEEWMEIAKQPRLKGPYILCYQVLSNERMQEVVNEIKKRTGYPIVSICNGTFKWIKSDYTFYDVSPEEFIGFYNDAGIVVSSSFHGTALGLVFNKPTYSLIKESGYKRIENIMNIFNSKEYMISKSTITIPSHNIDYEKTTSILKNERDKSIDFLMQMLNDN